MTSLRCLGRLLPVVLLLFVPPALAQLRTTIVAPATVVPNSTVTFEVITENRGTTALTGDFIQRIATTSGSLSNIRPSNPAISCRKVEDPQVELFECTKGDFLLPPEGKEVITGTVTLTPASNAGVLLAIVSRLGDLSLSGTKEVKVAPGGSPQLDVTIQRFEVSNEYGVVYVFKLTNIGASPTIGAINADVSFNAPSKPETANWQVVGDKLRNLYYQPLNPGESFETSPLEFPKLRGLYRITAFASGGSSYPCERKSELNIEPRTAYTESQPSPITLSGRFRF